MSQESPPEFRLMPSHLEAEEALLSAVLLDSTVLGELFERVAPEDFYKSAHQAIFRAAADLFKDNQPVDLITLSNRLREMDQLKAVGGAAHLAWIIDAIPASAHPASYAEIVREKAVRRRLIEKSRQVTRRCFEDRWTLRELIDFIESAFFDQLEEEHRSRCSPVGELMDDYMQLISGRTPDRRRPERREQEIAEISRGLKGLAKDLRVPVMALSQLNRMVEQRQNKRPVLSDLRESGSIEQDADIVMFIYREGFQQEEGIRPDAGVAEIILAKHRNGPVGNAKLAYLPAWTRFENLADQPV